jgi:hypothetical protein
MNKIRKYLVAATLTGGLAFAGAFGASGAVAEPAAAPAPVTATETATQAAVPQPGYLAVSRWKAVYSTYGGPSQIGQTTDEVIYALCQHDGLWGWYIYAWVPSLNSWGWLTNSDVTGYTNPVWWLDVC